MVKIRLFAQAAETAQVSQLEVQAETVTEAVTQATERFGPEFATVLESSNIWLNGAPTSDSATVLDQDELAILPPISGG